jgi:magnesium-dependent phosphatase 1
MGDSDIDTELIKRWKGLKKKPNVIVFDLDYTLWPYYVDCHVEPPIRKLNEREVVDSVGFKMNGFKDINKILKTLKEHCLNDNQYLAVASRSTTPKLAMEAIEALGWTEYFSSVQIYPKSKTIHMSKIKEDLKFESYDQVLFFDDEHTNIKETSKMGVCAILIACETGVDMNTLLNGLNKFNSKN